MNDDKVEIFFSLLRATYGADVLDRKWPSDLDKQLVKELKRPVIERLTIEEIRGAIDNASQQKAKGLDEFLFLDIDLILSGARRHGNQSHKMFLPSPEKTTAEKHKERLLANEKIQQLKQLFS